MTDLYSTLLGLAAAALAISWLILLAKRWRSAPRFSASAAVIALSLDLGSVLVHCSRGHGPSTPEPMTPSLFVREHPAFLVIGVAALVALGLGAHLRQHP
jgi:hypothetical protein